MFMVTMTLKGDELIIKGLKPFHILEVQHGWNQDGDKDVHVDAYAGIGSVLPLFGSLRGFNKST
jgi:hypothetical protein